MSKNNYNNLAKNSIASWYRKKYLCNIEKNEKISKVMCKKFLFQTSLFNCSQTNVAKANNIFNTYYENIRRTTYVKNKRFVKSLKTKEVIGFNADISIERALRYLYHSGLIELKKKDLEIISDALRIAIDDTFNNKNYIARKNNDKTNY